LRQADTTAPDPNAESARTRTRPVAPHALAVRIACVMSDAAPRLEPALPPRSRVAAMTGADRSVLIVGAAGGVAAGYVAGEVLDEAFDDDGGGGGEE
jgi:hypothetical protein